MLTRTLPLSGGGGEPFSEGPVSDLPHAELMTAGRHNHATDQSRELFHNALNIKPPNSRNSVDEIAHDSRRHPGTAFRTRVPRDSTCSGPRRDAVLRCLAPAAAAGLATATPPRARSRPGHRR